MLLFLLKQTPIKPDVLLFCLLWFLALSCFVGFENVTAKANGNDIKVTDAVAEVDGVIYFNIKEAIAAIDDEDKNEIELLRDLVITENDRYSYGDGWYDGICYIGDKDLVLNLNGFSITHNGSVNDYLVNFRNEGNRANTVTIKNGTIDAGTNAFCALCTSSASTQKITINLEDDIILMNQSKEYYDCIC